jgi:excisionase family DNA binding protein
MPNLRIDGFSPRDGEILPIKLALTLGVSHSRSVVPLCHSKDCTGKKLKTPRRSSRHPGGDLVAEPLAHPLMTIHAAALALGCSDMTIRRKVEARAFPAVKIGSKALVPRAFVERLIADAVAGRTVVVEEYAAEWAAEASAIREQRHA